MNKNDLITKITDKVAEYDDVVSVDKNRKAISKKLTGAYVDAICEVIQSSIAAGEEVTLPGIGKFSTRIQPARTGVMSFGNHKGEEWHSEEKKVATFKASSTLKEALENA